MYSYKEIIKLWQTDVFSEYFIKIHYYKYNHGWHSQNIVFLLKSSQPHIICSRLTLNFISAPCSIYLSHFGLMSS
jgi:hypothetical protein